MPSFLRGCRDLNSESPFLTRLSLLFTQLLCLSLARDGVFLLSGVGLGFYSDAEMLTSSIPASLPCPQLCLMPGCVLTFCRFPFASQVAVKKSAAVPGHRMGTQSFKKKNPILSAFFPTGVRCYARQVHVPKGPLYRVAGTTVSISCNVSAYEGPSQQDFEWFMYRPEAPTTSLGIISTKDSQFSYAVFGPRVASGDLQVQRLKGDSVVFKIGRLQAQDSGFYECYTPSTDTQYLGNYSAKVELRGTGL